MSLFKSASAAAAIAAAPAPTLARGLGDDSVLLASQALVTIDPIEVDGMARPFLDHQAAAYAYAIDAFARWGGAFLGDDMGLGKTQVLLALIAREIRNGGYGILVGPPVALGTYERELRVAFPHLKFAHLKGRTAGFIPDADVYFISDDAQSMQAWLTVETEEKDGKGNIIRECSELANDASIFVRDEIHGDKGQQAKPGVRGKVSLLMGEAMRRQGKPVVGVTGTLLTNAPIEGYIPLMTVGGEALLRTISPGAATASHYKHYYCNPTKVWTGKREVTVFKGADMSRMAQLHELLRRTVYVRREKDDLGDLLPHHGWVITPLALNGTMSRYRRIEKDFFNLILEENGPEAAWKAAKAETIVKMNKMWEEAGVAKAQAAAEYVINLVEQGKSVIVFDIHHEVRDTLAKHLLKSKLVKLVTIDGSVRGEDRTAAEDAIQSGRANVCIANIAAAGVALTLTGASEAVFVQVPWSAGKLAQAAGRIKRADQISIDRAKRGEAVTYHVLQAAYENGDSTFDMAMWQVLELKAQVCDAVNAGREITMPEESIMEQALVSWFNSKSRP